MFIAIMNGYFDWFLIAAFQPSTTKMHTHPVRRLPPYPDHLFYPNQLPDLLHQYPSICSHFRGWLLVLIRLESYITRSVVRRTVKRNDRIRFKTKVRMQHIPQLRTDDERRYDKQKRYGKLKND